MKYMEKNNLVVKIQQQVDISLQGGGGRSMMYFLVKVAKLISFHTSEACDTVGFTLSVKDKQQTEQRF